MHKGSIGHSGNSTVPTANTPSWSGLPLSITSQGGGTPVPPPRASTSQTNHRPKGVVNSRRTTLTPQEHAHKVRTIKRHLGEVGLLPETSLVDETRAANVTGQAVTHSATHHPGPQSFAEMGWSWGQWVVDTAQGFTIGPPGADAATAGTGQCRVDKSADCAAEASMSHVQAFQEGCRRQGFTDEEIEGISAAWKRNAIPLNAKTVPMASHARLTTTSQAPRDNLGRSSARHVRAVAIVNGEEKAYHIKFYDPEAGVGLHRNAAIQANDERREVRNLLASRIAQRLEWNEIPDMELVYLDGKVGLASEVVEGRLLTRDDLELKFQRSGHLSFTRIQFLCLLFGDIDAHRRQHYFRFNGAGEVVGIHRFDYDSAFGPRFMTIEQIINTPNAPVPVLPDPQDLPGVYNDFMEKLTEESLRSLADGLLNEKETEALVARLRDIRAYMSNNYSIVDAAYFSLGSFLFG